MSKKIVMVNSKGEEFEFNSISEAAKFISEKIEERLKKSSKKKEETLKEKVDTVVNELVPMLKLFASNKAENKEEVKEDSYQDNTSPYLNDGEEIDFSRALDALKQGLPVTRNSWTIGKFIYLAGIEDEDRICAHLCMTDPEEQDFSDFPYQPTAPDILADDWVVLRPDIEDFLKNLEFEK